MKLLTADWRNLAILTHEIDPEALRDRVPPGLVLDFWQGKCLVSLVGLQFLKTRALGVPIPFVGSFPEVNLRFYVRRQSNLELRRGVVFVKQIVPHRVVALAARRVYREQFTAMTVNLSLEEDSTKGEPHKVRYGWSDRHGRGLMEVRDLQPPSYPLPGTIEDFVTERYWGYNAQPGGGALEYLVDRPKWRVRCADSWRLEGNMARSFGPEFSQALSQAPVCALLADGAKTAIYRGRKIQ